MNNPLRYTPLLFFPFCQITLAQLPPATDIWLASISVSGERLRVGTPENITNRPGYDNQPSFTPDGSALFYTSLQTDPPGPQAPAQTDIFRYDIASQQTTRVTSTAESEYSPTVMPGGKTFSVVRVEPDSTQRLWQFDLNGQNALVFLPNVKAIGYHAWANAGTVALFVIGDSLTLQLANVASGKPNTVASGIGRSIQKVPGKNAVSFVHKISDTEWWIKEIDVRTRSVSSIMTTIPGSEDYTWTPSGMLVMAQGAKLFTFKSGHVTQWTEVADFSGKDVKNITRIAVSPNGDRIAFVAAE